MIDIVRDIRIRRLDTGETTSVALPLVPASATLTRTVESTEHGLVRTLNLTASLTEEVDGLRGNLIVYVYYGVGRTMCEIGTSGHPARFKVGGDDVISLSLEYQEQAGL